MVDQIGDLVEGGLMGATGDVTPAAKQARDEAEMYAANTKTLQDQAVSSLLRDHTPTLTFGAISQRGINVRDFGATGDGATDDTTAINAAIALASANGGGEVLFPRGVYRAGAIGLPSFVTLRGLGWPRIKLIDHADMAVTDLIAVSGDNQSMGRVAGLIVDGNRDNQSHPVNGVSIRGTGKGALYDDHYGDMEDVFVTYCSGDGVVVSAPTRSYYARRVVAVNNTGRGFNLNGSDNFYSDLISAANTGDGFLVSSANCVFAACKAFWCAYGFHALNGERYPIMGIQLVGCQMQENASHGYLLERCMAASLSGCVSDSNGRDGNPNAGFALADCEGCHVSGTVLNNPALAGTITYAVRMDGANAKNNVVDVSCSGTGTAVLDMDPASYDHVGASRVTVNGRAAGPLNMAGNVSLAVDSDRDGVCDQCGLVADAGVGASGWVDGLGQTINGSNVPAGSGVALSFPRIKVGADDIVTTSVYCRAPYFDVARFAIQYEFLDASGKSLGVKGLSGYSWSSAWIVMSGSTPAAPANAASCVIRIKIVNISSGPANIQGNIRNVYISRHR